MDDRLSANRLDPIRAPDWRYQLAKRRVDGALYCSPRPFGSESAKTAHSLRRRPVIDAAVCLTLGCRGPRSLEHVFRLRFTTPNLAGVAESMVVDGVARRSMGNEIGVLVEADDWCESAFFDARSRRATTEYTLQNVIEFARRCQPAVAGRGHQVLIRGGKLLRSKWPPQLTRDWTASR